MTNTQLGQLIAYVANAGVLLGVITFFVILHQAYKNKQFNNWLATNLYTLLRTTVVLMAIPIAGAFVELPPTAQIALTGLLAYLAPVFLIVAFLWTDGVPTIRRKLDVGVVTAELKQLYPGKNIICMPEDNPTEIICEIERTTEYSKIIAVTEKSEKHYHKTITETYKVLRGRLVIWSESNGKKYRDVLAPGLSSSLPPNTIHWVEGVDEYEDTWVEAVCCPPWTPEDHHVVR